MKRLLLVIAAIDVAAAAFAAWGRPRLEQVAPDKANDATKPPLPAEVKERSAGRSA